MVNLYIPDMAELFINVIQPYIMALAKRRLDTGEDFAPLEPKYSKFKQRLTGDLRPLRWKEGEREQLAPSLMNPSDAYHILQVSSNEVTLGSNAPNAGVIYGGTNQFGEAFPARLPYHLTDENKLELEALVFAYIQSKSEASQ